MKYRMGIARSGLGVIVMTKQRFSGKNKSFAKINAKFYLAIILTLFLVTTQGSLFAAGQDNFTYKFFSFSNISAEQGSKYLKLAQIGDVSHFPDSPKVLVTSSTPGNLQKAAIIKDLVDSTEEYAVKVIPSDSISNKLPPNNQIMDNIGTMAIGSFSNPPSVNGHSRTIVDTCKNGVIIITPARLMDRIVNTIKKLQNSESGDIFGQTFKAKMSKSNEKTFEPEIKIENKQPDTIPVLFAQNVSDNNQESENTVDETYLNERITDSTPQINENSTVTAPEPVETQPTLSDQNQLVNLSSIPNPDGVITMDLPEQLTLIEFLGWVGPYLKMDFMYNRADLENQDVTISPNGVLKGPIKIKELYYLLDSVLKFKGYAMTRGSGNLVTIVKKDNAISIEPTFVNNGSATIEPGDAVRIELFQLKYISTATAEDLIKKMQLSLQISSIPEAKTMIITEYTSRMPRIKALLDMVDKPGEPKEFRYRQLQYTMAPTLAPKIQSLAQQLGTISITINTTDMSSLPELPTQRRGESDAAFQARQRAYEAQIRQLTAVRQNAAATAGNQPVSSSVFLDSDERTNRILMIGLTDQLDEVDKLIDTLDVAQRDPRRLQIYKIEFLDAEEVLNKLQELNIIPKTQNNSGTSQRRTNQPSRPTGDTITREPVSVPTSVPLTVNSTSDNETPETLSEEPLAVLVASTNSLLVNATEEQHTRISDIIKLVDRAREEIPFKVYKLKNADPEHVLDVLEPLINKTVRGPDDKIQSVTPKQDEEITIVADANTSSLVVNANKKNQDWIETLIKELDKRKPQVLIDVTLVQISKTDAFDYDLNMISSFPDLTNTSGLTNAILPGISAGSSNLFNPPSGKDTRFADFQSNGGLGTGFLGDRHVNALLKLMKQKDYGRVMAKPKILVNDNQQGTISTTDTTYVTKTSSIPVTSGTGGNETSLIQTAIDYAPYDAGITLNITPHISESDLLRLDIQLTRSDFGTITGEKPPDTTDSTVGTTVTVPDGSTIILGGLLKLNQSKGGTKIPLLGDIPFIGSIFRSTSNSDIQRNLYVFVKAEIIRAPEDNSAQPDLERISDINRKVFEQHEEEFQSYQSFPGIKPSPMEPDKVLDAQ